MLIEASAGGVQQKILKKNENEWQGVAMLLVIFGTFRVTDLKQKQLIDIVPV